AALSVAAGAPYTLILSAGLVLAPAAHGAVIVTGVTAVVTTALAWLWFGVRPWPARTAGLVLVVIGLALVGSLGVGGGGHAWLGDALFIVAGELFALFTVGARHWRVDPLPATAAVWVLALPYVPIYAAGAWPRVLEGARGSAVFRAGGGQRHGPAGGEGGAGGGPVAGPPMYLSWRGRRRAAC